jgi:hypothetical protein
MTVSGRRPLLTIFLISVSIASAQDFKKQVIYQIITDRFVNGSTANDNPAQSAGLFDSTKTNWHLFWGGDLTGIQQKLSYFEGHGCDRNLDLAASGQPQS